MKLFCSILLLFSILAGCSPEARQEARKAQLRSYSLKCHKEYGFKFSSDAHRNCKQQLDMAANQPSQRVFIQNYTPPKISRAPIIYAPISSANNWGTGWD